MSIRLALECDSCGISLHDASNPVSRRTPRADHFRARAEREGWATQSMGLDNLGTSGPSDYCQRCVKERSAGRDRKV